MILDKNSKLVFIGDSITDCNRVRPVGEGSGEAWGFGYAAFAASLLQSAYPENKYRIVNMGISGDRVRELKERWERDVVSLAPDYLSIMIGVNDVWRIYEYPTMPELHVYEDEYRATLEELIKAIRPSLKGLILLSPFFIEENKEDSMRKHIEKYGQIVKELSEKYDGIFVDTQKAIDELLKHNYSAHYAVDRVHPNIVGHMAIAREFLRSIEYSF